MRKNEVGNHCTVACKVFEVRRFTNTYYCQVHNRYVRICDGCGARFHYDYGNTRTCSDKCRQRASRKARAGKLARSEV